MNLMRSRGKLSASVCFLLSGLSFPAQAQSVPTTLEPARESGQGVTGAFEGWFRNPDGSFNLLFGYFNRNLKEELDIPIGTNNRMEPGNPDQGQPTHFLTRRQWGVFTVTVPRDFGSKKLTWTLNINHQNNAVPGNLDRLKSFRSQVIWRWYRALRRRSQRSRMTWVRFRLLMIR